MKDELFGIGRTWLMVMVVIVGATVMFGMGKITAQMWQDILTWMVTVGGGKSAIVGTASVIKK